MGEGVSFQTGATAANTSYYSNLMGVGSKNKDPKTIARMFEGMFFRMLLKPIEENQEDDPLFNSPAMSQTNGMFYDELANSMGGMGQLGIADLIEADLKKDEQKLQGLLKERVSNHKDVNHG